MKATARTLLILPLLLGACGPEMTVTITGEVDGLSLSNVTTAAWGGPFIVFSDRELACDELAWIQKSNLDGDPAPYDSDITALQITFNDAPTVIAGNYDLTGEAPVKAELLNVADEAFTVIRATTGTLEIEDFEGEDPITGTFGIGFGDESLSGDFAEVPWCTNLKSRN